MMRKKVYFLLAVILLVVLTFFAIRTFLHSEKGELHRTVEAIEAHDMDICKGVIERIFMNSKINQNHSDSCYMHFAYYFKNVEACKLITKITVKEHCIGRITWPANNLADMPDVGFTEAPIGCEFHNGLICIENATVSSSGHFQIPVQNSLDSTIHPFSAILEGDIYSCGGPIFMQIVTGIPLISIEPNETFIVTIPGCSVPMMLNPYESNMSITFRINSTGEIIVSEGSIHGVVG